MTDSSTETYHLAVVSMNSSWYDTVKENLAARLLTRCNRFHTLPIVQVVAAGTTRQLKLWADAAAATGLFVV